MLADISVAYSIYIVCGYTDMRKSNAVMYFIIETAKANGINLYYYLEYLLEKLPNLDRSDESYESICPWTDSVKA